MAAAAPLALGDFREARRRDAASDRVERHRVPLSALPGAIRLRHYEPARDYQLGQQASPVAGGGVREERIDLPAVLPAESARALAQRLAAAAGDGRETLIWQGDLAALALPVGQVVTLADGGVWRVAGRTVRARDILIELKRHQPLPSAELPAEPGVPVNAPDWPDAVGIVEVFDLPNMGTPAASAPRVLIAAAGSNDGWRGADCWLVPAAGAEPVPVGTVRPAAALGRLAAPLGAGSDCLFDLSGSIAVTLVNPAMTLESVDDAALLGGANRAMVGRELLQFGIAEALGAGRWRLSRLLRGRAGTADEMVHGAGEPFVLLDDPALLTLSEALAGWTEGGGAVLQWIPRGGTMLTEVAIPASGRALRPLAPVHGRVRPDGAGGLTVRWTRRSRIDAGWRDHVDQPSGESRELWHIAVMPPVPGAGPWERSAPGLDISAATLAALPSGCAIEIREMGDFARSPPLVLPLT